LVGFDLDRYRRLSVGLLAIEDTLRASLESGDAVYDFTIGDYAYKLQFGGEPTPLYERHIARTIRGRLAIFAIDAARETKRVLKPLIVRARRSRLAATAVRLVNPRPKSASS
jgi:CelD/BcsL family acetyltransferase involved in cellulose biosynthesis